MDVVWKLIVVMNDGQQVDVDYPDVETARQTGKDWLTKGWARGFFIERA
jgi:hypothetical protein